MKNKFFYQCVNCNTEYEANELYYMCPSCSRYNQPDTPPAGVLKVLYDYKSLKSRLSIRNIDKLKKENYLSVLPLENAYSFPPLRTGNTPLYKLIDDKCLSPAGINFWLKDDSQNPTFSFKDRASAVVSAYAKEKKISTIVTASTGNAGSSLAGICASQHQRSVVFVPAKAPIAKLFQIMMYGAMIIPVDGSYDEAFDISVKATEIFGLYNRNTAFNPLTIEGKKTAAFEIFSQLGNQLPDFIFVPTGDGVILSGIYKGFEDLLLMDIIGHMPVIVAVQAEGSANIVSNLAKETPAFPRASTIADSISVDIPRNYFMAIDYLRKYHGNGITVDDSEIIEASIHLARKSGIFTEPAGAAAFAGMQKYSYKIGFPDNSNVVVLLTGSGLKDTDSVRNSLKLPEPVEPDFRKIEEILSKLITL